MARDRGTDDYDDDKSRSRRDRDDDDRPARRSRRDDDGDDRPGRNSTPSMSVLGLFSLIGGIFSLLVSFIPCIGAIAIVGGVIGLILGGIGMLVANGANHGKGLPISGIIVNVLSIAIAGAWLAFGAAMVNQAGQQAEQNRLEIESGSAIPVTAAQLYDDYDANAIESDRIYKDNVVEVTGVVARVNPKNSYDFTVELRTSTKDKNIDCNFPSPTGNSAKPSSIIVGSIVVIRGRCKGKYVRVVVEDCIISNGTPLKVDLQNPDDELPATADDPPVKGPKKTGEKLPTPPKREVAIKISAYDLYEAFADDDDAAMKVYGGRLVEVTGEVMEIGKLSPKKITLKEIKDGQLGAVTFYFDKGEEVSLAGLKLGMKITIRGTATRQMAGYLRVEQCKLVKE